MGNDAPNIVLQRKITTVVFSDMDDLNRRFAEELVDNGFQVRSAYTKAYDKVIKVKASNLLEDPAVWNHFFKRLAQKQSTTPYLAGALKAYNEFIDDFQIDPFTAYLLYVQLHPDISQPIASIVSSDPAKDFTILIHLHKFFTAIRRVYFVRKVEQRMAEDLEQVKQVCDPKQWSRICRMCKTNEIDLEEICEEKPLSTQMKLEL